MKFYVIGDFADALTRGGGGNFGWAAANHPILHTKESILKYFPNTDRINLISEESLSKIDLTSLQNHSGSYPLFTVEVDRVIPFNDVRKQAESKDASAKLIVWSKKTDFKTHCGEREDITITSVDWLQYDAKLKSSRVKGYYDKQLAPALESSCIRSLR